MKRIAFVVSWFYKTLTPTTILVTIFLKIIFLLQISYSPHSGTNTKIKWDMCLCILNIILKYAVGTCLWLYWKLTLNTHFLLDFIYFHETIDFSLTSVTSSHVHIWQIVTILEVIYCRPDWALSPTWVFFLTLQGFQSGPVPGTFTRLRSCIVPAEITEPPTN
jgi:hypothetical protein